jgi:hypothetical protein
MQRYFLAGVMVLAVMTGAARAQIRTSDSPAPTMPVFTPPESSSPPPAATQHGIDAAGNAVDTGTTYRSGPFGTYTDHTTTTTYPPGNPAAGMTITH